MMSTAARRGPLLGTTVIEMAGIGPGPFAGMLLADMGADVIRIDRPGTGTLAEFDLMARGKRSIVIDLKRSQGVETVLRLCAGADLLIEGYRPGVMERLGLGPDVCLARQPRLIYGRMTGFGQTGPLAQRAGHDINFLSLSGALHAIGQQRQPTIPLNLVADLGGGSLFLVMGLLAGLVSVKNGGTGQVVDAAMVDGATSLTTFLHGLMAAGFWQDQRETNFLDGAAHFYNVYETSDGQWLALGAIEPQFYTAFFELVGLDQQHFQPQLDRDQWPRWREELATLFRSQTQAQWLELFAGSDACVTPVLSLKQAANHPHNAARATLADSFGVIQPQPAPRFSSTEAAISGPPPELGAHGAEVLRQFGFSPAEIETLTAARVVGG